MNLPNALTLLRILLIPVFVILIMNKETGWALLTFAVAGVTDGVDGLLARLTHQRTELGAFLDPIADKLLLSSTYITLAIIELLPSWLAVVVITRDVVILLGFLVFFLTDHRPELRPSFVSKMTTLFQISTVLLAMLGDYYPLAKSLGVFFIYGTVVLTVISGAHYILLGTRVLNEKTG